MLSGQLGGNVDYLVHYRDIWFSYKCVLLPLMVFHQIKGGFLEAPEPDPAGSSGPSSSRRSEDA